MTDEVPKLAAAEAAHKHYCLAIGDELDQSDSQIDVRILVADYNTMMVAPTDWEDMRLPLMVAACCSDRVVVVLLADCYMVHYCIHPQIVLVVAEDSEDQIVAELNYNMNYGFVFVGKHLNNYYNYGIRLMVTLKNLIAEDPKVVAEDDSLKDNPNSAGCCPQMDLEH